MTNFKSSKSKLLTATAITTFAIVSLSGCATTSSMPAPAAEVTSPNASVAATPSKYNINLWPTTKDAGLIDAEIENKITALMADMTLEEKVGQTIQGDIAFIKPEDLKKYPLGSILAGGNSAPNGNERSSPQAWLDLADDYWKAGLERPSKVKIPVLFGIDAVHGHSNLIGAIIFPHNIGLGNMRDPELIKKIGQVTAKEMAIAGVDWTFAPTVAVPQDDRWGRAYEGYSEHPEIVRSYAGKMVEGLQGTDGGDNGIKPGHIAATAKHFLGDGGTKDGVDQGNAIISEEELINIHNAGYPPSIEAGTVSVMASFSSWNGDKITGSKYLLTDVLKDRMGFQGFVVGDWNAHGQLPGCTNTNCPQALNAGLDMYMAPDSWKDLYHNTLAQVKSGEIPMARLDDAVRRILRGKFKSGLFTLGAPKERALSGQFQNLGSPEHRAIARESVRKSLVLIKNNNKTLPLKGGSNILVAGDGADNIGKQSGGWTITWQGTGNSNSDFPNGQSIYGGIKDAVSKMGGTATLNVDGKFTKKPDAAIVVIGEEPYAEFQGDRANLDYQPEEAKDLALIKSLKAQGIPVVTVFLSGRPMFTNPEINASDAFVAAFLPGSEGGGVADLLIGDNEGKKRFDFTGKLSFSWPKIANGGPLNSLFKPYDPQFAYGYGLTYSNPMNLEMLSENSGITGTGIVKFDTIFTSGRFKAPWSFVVADINGATKSNENGTSPKGVVTQTVIDAAAQESARKLVFNGTGLGIARATGDKVDLSRQTTGDMVIKLRYRLDASITGTINFNVGRDENISQGGKIDKLLARTPVGKWGTLTMRLSCFKNDGQDMKQISMPFAISTSSKLSISYDSIEITSNDSGDAVCPE